MVDLFLLFVVVMWPCLLLCNYKMLKCSTDFSVHGSFSAFEDYLNATLGPGFAGFNCPDFRIRWIQLVVDGLLHFLWLLLLPCLSIGVPLHVQIIFIGRYVDFHIRWIQLL